MTAKKYFFSEEDDRFIRRYYDGAIPRRSHWIGKKLGIPHWAVKKRAAELGLCRVKDRRWSLEEENYLHTRYHRTSVKKLAKHLGRSVTAVKLKAKRLGLRKYAEGYTACSLAEALGVDPHWVTDRIRRGMISASYRNTERTEAQGGDSYLITDSDFLRFVRQHPYEIDLRKVDPYWFMDLIAAELGYVPGPLENPENGSRDR